MCVAYLQLYSVRAPFAINPAETNLCLFITMVCVLVCSASNDVNIDSDITTDTIFSASISSYIISKKCMVLSAVTLFIEPGAVIKYTTNEAALVVKGTLLAIGRPDARITFDGVAESVQSMALHILSEGAASVDISFAVFSNFSEAVHIEC